MKTITSVATLSLVVLCSCGTNSDSAQSGQVVSGETPTQQQELECKFKPTAEMQEGLNLYKTVPGDEVCGGYREGDHSVSFHAISGEDLILGENTFDPDAPAYEVSARFIDMGGHSFVMALGHDERNATWSDVEPELVSAYDGENRDTDLALAVKTATALRNALAQGFDVEIETMEQRSYTASLTPEQVAARDGVQYVAEQIRPKASVYTYWIQIRKKDAFSSGNENNKFDHSAIWFQIKDPSGRKMLDLVTSNHGTAADLLNPHCQVTYYKTYGYTPNVQMLPCDRYNTYGLHVCNDDTYVQYYQARLGVTYSSVCTDRTPLAYAPKPGDCR